MSNVEELRTKFREFQIACKTILPKVDSCVRRGRNTP